MSEAVVSSPEINEALLGMAPSRSLAADAWDRFRRNRLAMFGLVLVAFLVLVAVFGPFVVDDPTKLYPFRNEPPTNQHWFGLDSLGRDQLARVVYGIRLSLFIGLVTAFLETVIGIVIGALAGWMGGIVDSILMRFVDILLGIPYLLLAFAVISIVGRGVTAVIGTIAATAWLQTSRSIRAGVLQAKGEDYVAAARVVGVPTFRLVRRHVLPNVIQPVIVLSTMGIGAAVLSEAAFSYLGVGIQEPAPSLGLMIDKAQGMFGSAPHLLIFPGLALIMTVLGFLLVGDGLRDALDVKDTGV